MDKFLTWIEDIASRYLTRRKRLKVYREKEKHTLLSEVWSWVDALVFAIFWVIIINQFLFQFFVIPSPSMVSTLNVGDRVVVTKNAYGTEIYPAGPKVFKNARSIERDDIITFYNPEYDSKGPVFDVLSQAIFMGTFSLVNIDTNPDGTPRERLYVKRAVGSPSDMIRFENGDVFIRPTGESEFISEEVFRNDNGLSNGPHRSVDYSLYPGLEAYAEILAYQETGKDMYIPSHIMRTYSSLPENTRLFDLYEVEKETSSMKCQIDPSDFMFRSEKGKYERGIYVPSSHVLPLGDNRDNSRDGRYFGPVDHSSVNGRVIARFWPIGDISILTDD